VTEIHPGLYRDAEGHLLFYLTALLPNSGLPQTPQSVMEIRRFLMLTAAATEGKGILEIAD
jgi:hypothetical protein